LPAAAGPSRPFSPELEEVAMPGPRWDELERAIRARDSDAAERIWLELLEQDLSSVDGFLKAADGIAEKAGGRRQAGVLLGMVAAALKDKGRDRDLVRLQVRLAKVAPDDGTLRTALTESVRRAYAGRADVEQLLEKSGVVGGPPTEFAKQAEALERYLRLEPGAFVFHKTGWGIGQIAEYLPERGRCVIDFLSKRGHAMDLLAAADLLERLPEDDLRVMAAYRRDELKALAVSRPLEVLRKVLTKLGNDAPLRHVKDTLVPDIVEKTAWAGWWKEAKKQATVDPAFTLGAGADPRITFTPGGSADFASLVERQLSFAKDAHGRRAVLRELARTAGQDPGARATLVAQAKTELGKRSPQDLAGRLAWTSFLAGLENHDPSVAIAPILETHPDPAAVLAAATDDEVRAFTARGLLRARPDQAPEILIRAALEQDVAVADLSCDHFIASQRIDLLERILAPAFDEPMRRPLLYAWAVRGLVRSRWPGRSADPYKVAEQVLRVLDGTAYGAKRDSDPERQRAVDSLSDLLQERNCRIMADACAGTDAEGARHLLRLIDRNRGLKPRPREKLSDTILRAHPTALRDAVAAGAADEVAVPQEIYMTAAGLERLRREHDRIVNEEMPSNAAEIQRAREFGDLSENAEYHAAREKQAMLLAKSQALQGMISLAREIRPDIVRTDAVSVGARVRLRGADGGDVTYTLLGPSDVDVDRNVINYQTPLGQSLMGKKPGDLVKLEVMGSVHLFEVLEIASGV
jgi:transcription elongation factor GreA